VTPRDDDWRDAINKRAKIAADYRRATLPGRLAKLGVRIHTPPRFGPIPEQSREFPKL
jgi:hypothetical protein